MRNRQRQHDEQNSPAADTFRTTIESRRKSAEIHACVGCVVLLTVLVASTALAGEQAKLLLALIDYIGSDYRNAVQAGKILDQDEYQEMTEFAARSLELFNQLKASEGRDTAGIEKELHVLASHINERSGDKVVPDLAQQIKERLIATY